MPSIKWHHVWAQPTATLTIVAVATLSSARELLMRLAFPFRHNTLRLRNALARIWLGTTFALNGAIFYSEPVADDVQHVQQKDVDLYILHSIENSTVKLVDAHAVVLYVHGGGMIMGHPLQYLDEYRRWVEVSKYLHKQVVFVAVKYRMLSPLCRHIPARDESIMCPLTDSSPFSRSEMAGTAISDVSLVPMDSRPGSACNQGGLCWRQRRWQSCRADAHAHSGYWREDSLASLRRSDVSLG